MRIKPGEPAKEFEVSDVFDNSINLRSYKGKKLLLSFYRYASCPFCNLRVHQIIQHHEAFQQKSLCVLAFFQSPKKSILQYVGEQNAPFPIIADPSREVFRLYGVESSWKGVLRTGRRVATLMSALKNGFIPGKMEGSKALLPADFLVDCDLIVKEAYYGKDIGDHLPMEIIRQFIS